MSNKPNMLMNGSGCQVVETAPPRVIPMERRPSFQKKLETIQEDAAEVRRLNFNTGFDPNSSSSTTTPGFVKKACVTRRPSIVAG
ncbi:hypothetical protein Scep_015284 [Stephania cephalantha]|uniref:Uncharacterized protein n=1 Tax=Stephania cephalantha TaxID=152367 RepID=A0AAP0J4U3_9MAGN